MSNAQALRQLARELECRPAQALSVALGLTLRAARSSKRSGWLHRDLWLGPSKEYLERNGWRQMPKHWSQLKGAQALLSEFCYGPTGSMNGDQLWIGRWYRRKNG